MKKLLLLTALVLISGSAHAQLGSIVQAKVTKICDLRSQDNNSAIVEYAIGFKQTNANYMWMQSNVGEFKLYPGQCLNEKQIASFQSEKKLFMDYTQIYNLRIGQELKALHYAESASLLTVGTGKFLKDYQKDNPKKSPVFVDLDKVKGKTETYTFSANSMNISADVTFIYDPETTDSITVMDEANVL